MEEFRAKQAKAEKLVANGAVAAPAAAAASKKRQRQQMISQQQAKLNDLQKITAA